MKQKILEIDNINIPYIEEMNNTWYPVKFIQSKILGTTGSIPKCDKYNGHIKKFVIDFSYLGSSKNIQETNCIDYYGMNIYLKNLNKNRIDISNLDTINILLKYFNVDNIVINSKRNEYINDIIENCKIEKQKICVKCNNEFPASEEFFYKDERASDDVGSICRECSSKDGKFIHKSKYLQKIYYKFGLEKYVEYKNKNIVERWYDCLSNKINIEPDEKITGKENQDKLIKLLLDDNILNKTNMSMSYICDNILKDVTIKIKLEDLYDYKYPDWRCKIYNYPLAHRNESLSNKKSFEILKNYMIDNGYKLDGEEVYKYDYYVLCKNARCTNELSKTNILEYVMKFYNNEKYCFKFNICSSNYYESKENRIFTFKQYVKFLGIHWTELPLHISKYRLRTHSNTLYNILRKYYNGNLFKWINEVYPNEYREEQFSVDSVRNGYDSIEEREVDYILKENVKDGIVMYVGSDNKNKILNTTTPDWIIVKDDKTIVVEYFGMYNKGSDNIVEKKYNEYHDKKVEIYKNSIRNSQYYYLFLYNKDLKNKGFGIKNKLKLLNETNDRIIGLK